MTGTVFDIQRYSIHDGPGIRSTVFMKGCPLRCFWCQNPESQATKPEILLNRNLCTRCGRCAQVCVAGAGRLSDQGVTIDRDRCIGCGRCVEACLSDARVLAGREMTVDEVMAEVIKDKAMYDNSGGGVTLSGGDPLMQPEFSAAVLRSCKERGLHTAVETCGYASWPVVQSLLDHTDLVLFDIKCIDATKHRDATGKDNRLILDNACRIAAVKSVRVRMPLIPGFNDSADDVKAVLRFVREELGLDGSSIDLLRYNKFGEAKFDRLDRRCARPSMEPQTDKHLAALNAILKTP